MRRAQDQDRGPVVVIYQAMPYLLAVAPFVIVGVARMML